MVKRGLEAAGEGEKARECPKRVRVVLKVVEEPAEGAAATKVSSTLANSFYDQSTSLSRQQGFLKRIAGKSTIVLIDAHFNHHHNSRNIKSLSQQIMYSYNACSSRNVLLYVCGIDEALKEAMQKAVADRWCAYLTGRTIEEIVERKGQRDELDPLSNAVLEDASIVYLTADSEYTLNEADQLVADDDKETAPQLKKTRLYVIGGLIDRNRLKYECYKKALCLKVEHAKLPITATMEKLGCKVLTTNQVAEIVAAHAAEKLSWEDACAKAVPVRKMHS